MFALIRNNKIETFNTSKEARKSKRFTFERIIKVDEQGLIDLEQHINLQKKRFLQAKVKTETKVMGWDFEKLTKEIKKELKEEFLRQNTSRVKQIIIDNKISPNCASCSYNADTAAEWIEDAINKNIL